MLFFMTIIADNQKSPLIRTIKWGRMDIEHLGSGKDFKLWPGGGRPWNWQETGTRHSPGIQVADVRELVDHGCQSIVLTKGILSRLKIPAETTTYLERLNIEIHVASTKKGVAIYNALAADGQAVGGLFHSTC